MRYLVGWNTLGADPDFPPREADSWEAAREMLKCELYWLSADAPGLKDPVNQALAKLNTAEPDVSVACNVADFVFWIEYAEIYLDFGNETRPFYTEDGTASST